MAPHTIEMIYCVPVAHANPISSENVELGLGVRWLIPLCKWKWEPLNETWGHLCVWRRRYVERKKESRCAPWNSGKRPCGSLMISWSQRQTPGASGEVQRSFVQWTDRPDQGPLSVPSLWEGMRLAGKALPGSFSAENFPPCLPLAD